MSGNPVGEQCDVCGKDVPADDLVKTELTVAGAVDPVRVPAELVVQLTG